MGHVAGLIIDYPSFPSVILQGKLRHSDVWKLANVDPIRKDDSETTFDDALQLHLEDPWVVNGPTSLQPPNEHLLAHLAPRIRRPLAGRLGFTKKTEAYRLPLLEFGHRLIITSGADLAVTAMPA